MTPTTRLQPDLLEDWIKRLINAAGCSPDDAAMVAEHLIEADASGHPSHGIVRVERYLDWVRAGKLKAETKITAIMDSGNMLLLDGHFSFGQVIGHRIISEAASRVAEHGIALVAVRHAGHLGRIGAWAERLANSGLISVSFVTVAGSRIVAPFGAREARLSTAPVAIGIPNNTADGSADPFVLDFATSRVAEGKVLVAQKTGSSIPPDSLVDADGEDNNDPVTLYGDSATEAVPNPRLGPGALQTMGQHKGSGLGLACELLAGALTGAGTNADDGPGFGNGMLTIAICPKRFGDQAPIRAEINRYITSIRNAAPRQPGEPVMIPGDPERMRRKQMATEGIPLSAEVISGLVRESRHYGVSLPAGLEENG